MSDWFHGVTMICMVVIGISILMLVYRAIKGPSNPDRAVAIDSIGINLIAMTGVLCVHLDTAKFQSIILLIGILTFIGTVATAKFIEKGVVIERDRD